MVLALIILQRTVRAVVTSAAGPAVPPDPDLIKQMVLELVGRGYLKLQEPGLRRAVD